MKELEYFFSEKKMLNKLEDISKKNKVPIISNDVGRLLETIIFIKQPEKILEIGCGEGYSTYYIVKNLKKGFYTGIDLNKKRLQKAEIFISKNFSDISLEFIHGNVLNILLNMEKKFDFVFIDAAKYEYIDYIKSIVEKLNDNAIIVADNIFFSEKIFANFVKEHDRNSVSGIKQFIRFLSKSEFLQTIFLDIGDGISVSVFKK